MIRHQLVQWILLPAGLTGDGMLRASVFVAPRLRPGEPATLADFPDFADWPAALQGLDLLLVRPDGTTEAPRRVTVSASTGLWQALLPPETTVRAFAFEDFADRPLISYPVATVLDFLRGRWAELAHAARDDLPVTNTNASPVGGPSTGPDGERPFTLSRHFAELMEAAHHGVFEGAPDRDELSRRLRAQLDDAAERARHLRLQHATRPQQLIRPFAGVPGPAGALYSLAGFHARPSQDTPREFPSNQEQDQVAAERMKSEDFHDHLTALGDHPALLRGLGLVLDLEIRPDFVPTTTDTAPPGRLRLRIERRSAFPRRADDPGADTWNADVTPWTACRLSDVDGQLFFDPAERTERNAFAHGFLRMAPDRLFPVTVDVDGLALKAMNTAVTLQRQEEQEQRPVEEPERDGVPTARTGGLAVMQARHADELHADFYRARSHNDRLEQNPDNPPLLCAEDLVRGYRMDIRTGTGWQSLHHRRTVYTPQRDPQERMTVDDEGCVQPSLTAEADTAGEPADPDRPLYAHEVLVTWDGWSLSVPRPGEAVPQEPAPPEARADLGGMRLSIDTSALPRTLPRLRFRSGYRFRLRTVDLAGNAHTLPDADRLGQILENTGDDRYLCAAPADELPYLRFEPVPPPEILPRFPFGPGEGMERLAIRSAPGQTAARWSEEAPPSREASRAFRAFCDRHIAAPKASLHLVETHGLLDGTIDAVQNGNATTAAAAAQSSYTFASRECGSFRDHPDTPQGYVWVDADSVDLPYLPDPLCAGIKARLALEPGAPEEVLDIRFEQPSGDEWPAPMPVRLRLEEGEVPSAWYSAVDRLLIVGLPPGRTARLRLSSLFLDDPGVFALLRWCEEVLGTHAADEVRDAIAGGTHWMTTPWRDLTLVHAVQRPLEQPHLVLMDLATGHCSSLARPRGATAAELEGLMYFDPRSTGRLDLSADWDETEDDASTDYPDEDAMVRQVRQNVFSLPVPEPFGTQWLPEIQQILGPLEGGKAPFRTFGPEGETPESLRAALLDDASAPGLDTAERRRLEAGAAQLETFRAHEFGDTKYRRVTYQFTAATRFREYFDPAMPTADGMSVDDPFTVAVLSSGPPAKPEVLQVLPLMDYTQRQRPDGSVISERRNVGLRVWLARPWFSSGAEEMLAVVCHDGLISPLTELSREISCLLQDPAHISAVPQRLIASSFPEGIVRESVPLCDAPFRRDIAAFRPVWDARRKAWYADLRFSTGTAYFPFARLGLARYQEHSISGCELSHIVPTAFVQTVPDRTLTCTVTGTTARLALSGPAPSSSADAAGNAIAGSNLIIATVETQDRQLADPWVGWTPLGSETHLACTLGGDHTATWHGDVPLPDGHGRRLRVAIREYELHPADDPAGRRLVHADVVPLPTSG